MNIFSARRPSYLGSAHLVVADLRITPSRATAKLYRLELDANPRTASLDGLEPVETFEYDLPRARAARNDELDWADNEIREALVRWSEADEEQAPAFPTIDSALA